MRNDKRPIQQQIKDGFVDLYIDTVDCDEVPTEINVYASIGEIDGIGLNVNIERTKDQPGRVETLALAADHARQLRDALTAAITCLETHGGA